MTDSLFRGKYQRSLLLGVVCFITLASAVFAFTIEVDTATLKKYFNPDFFSFDRSKEYVNNGGDSSPEQRKYVNVLSTEYNLKEKGARLVTCPIYTAIRTKEECIEAGASLGIVNDGDVPVFQIGKWNNSPSGCFSDNSVLHFSTYVPKEGEETKLSGRWKDYSLICYLTRQTDAVE
jgi:hypothetical protein